MTNLQGSAGDRDVFEADAAFDAAHPEVEADADFAMQLLVALTTMAARSKRGQADLTAALRGAGLVAEPRQVRAALRLLQAQGRVEHFVPLSDGGLLLSVTQKASNRFAEASQWLPQNHIEA